MTTVYFNVSNAANQPLTSSTAGYSPNYNYVTLAPTSFPLNNNESILDADVLTYYPDANGSFTASLYPQVYKGYVRGVTTHTHFFINVPTSSIAVNAADYLIVPTGSVVNLGKYAYNMAQSDARYVLSGSTIISSSYALTSSYSLNAIPTISASWASQSLSSSYVATASYNPFPDITDTGGKIGINQTNPQYKLDVGGDFGNSQTSMYHLSNTGLGPVSWVNGGAFGYFGVGTSNPQYSLDVQQGLGTTPVIGNSSGSLIIQGNQTLTDNGNITINAGGGASAYNGGNVTINAGSSITVGTYTNTVNINGGAAPSNFIGGNINLVGGAGQSNLGYIQLTGSGVGINLNGNSPKNALDVVGNISCSVITASLHFGTSSYSNNGLSSSYAVTSSYSNQTLTASYIATASNALSSSFLRLYDSGLGTWVTVTSVNGVLTLS